MKKTEAEFLEEIREIVSKRLKPDKIWLFGSRAGNNGNSNSDFDIAFEGTDAAFREKRKVREELYDKTGIYSVDLVDLNETSQEFSNLVREEGKIIYERD